VRAFLATACLALGLGSCSDSGNSLGKSVDPGTQEFRQPPAGGFSPTPGDSTGVGAIIPAEEVRHGGERLVEVFDEGLLSLSYREQILTDGEGAFSLRPLEALTSVGPEWESIQRSQQGFLFRYRDFAVRDRWQFTQNHLLIDLGNEVVVAGRPCARYRVERTVGESRTYELSVDVETGQTLAYEELDQDQRLVARMTYETYDAEPDLTTAIWFEPTLQETSLLDTEPLRSQTGYPVPLPRILPAGYTLFEVATLQVSNREWIKLTFTDGNDPLFFLYQPTQETVQSAGPLGISAKPDPEREPNIYLSRMGAAGAAQATLADGLYIAVGKVSEDDLVSLIETAFP